MSNTSKSKRQKQKEESLKAKRYLKAKFKASIGYWFIAVWYFFRNNIIRHKKLLGTLFLVLTIILIVFSIYNFLKASAIQSNIVDYNKDNQKFESTITQKQKEIKKQNEKIGEYNLSASPQIARTSKVLSTVFHGMYDYTDSKTYQKNRNINMKYFEKPNSKEVRSIYNEDKDTADESIIDNLDLNSNLLEYNIYTKDINPKDNNSLKLKAIVKYQSTIRNVSSNYATRTHETIYDIEFNAEKNKILSIKKVNTVKEHSNIE